MIPLIPFCIELPADHFLIKAKKKDLSWKTRTILIALSCLACWLLEGSEFNVEGLKVIGSSICLALVPYCFFDLALNKLRGKKWWYVSTTNGKFFDKQFAKLNPWALLVGRCLLFVGLIFGWIKLMAI